MISILPPKNDMSSDDKIAKLEAQLWKAKTDKPRREVEEWQVTEEKVAAFIGYN